MNGKVITVIVYLVIGFFVAIYQHFFGELNYKPFGYHLGVGLVWPVLIFPSLGKIIGGMIILIVIGILLLRANR